MRKKDRIQYEKEKKNKNKRGKYYSQERGRNQILKTRIWRFEDYKKFAIQKFRIFICRVR